jgi:hypothetical protein
MTTKSLPLLAALLLASVPPALAQRSNNLGLVAVGLTGSTLGIGPEISLHLSPRLGLRAGYHYLSLDFEETVDEIRYDIRPDWRNLTALVDLHPFANAFRLTGGLVLWNTSAKGDAVLTGPVTIGDVVYQPAQVGSLTGTADYSRTIAPLVGLGIAGRGRFAVMFDLGIVMTGHPKVDLTVNSPLTGAERAQLDAEVQKEKASAQAEIDDQPLAKYYPVVSLGFKIRF